MQSRPGSIDIFRRVDSSFREVDSYITKVDSYLKWKSTPVLEELTPKLQQSDFSSHYRSVGSSIINIKKGFLEKVTTLSRSIILKHTQALKHPFQSSPRLSSKIDHLEPKVKKKKFSSYW